jgi:isocitrate dehydrogenase
MNVVIIRENEEDLYAGIEHQQTPEVAQCLKLITRPGTEKIVRYAFEYARTYNRKKVTCFTKDNIMKITDGLFHKVFDEVAAEYPDIENEHWIVDIGAAKLADTPDRFDVVVLPNLYGDILSDVSAQIAGSVGLAGAANVGEDYAMFEAIHGSAPRRAGQNLANPSGLLHGAILMLVHIDQPDVAEKVHNAWLKTIEDGIHTYDIYSEDSSTEKVGTKEFGEAVVARLGQKPVKLDPVSYERAPKKKDYKYVDTFKRPEKKEIVGVDVFIDHKGITPDDLGDALLQVSDENLKISMISNRGQKVWPKGFPETFCTDHWRCRFYGQQGPVTHRHIVDLLDRLEKAGHDFIKIEELIAFDGVKQFALGQGENLGQT